ncbi:MAG: transcriptional regulator [Lachnospiraceae bacterium]|nr:transcriptional regulator [Lachnospiraceae bacterium]
MAVGVIKKLKPEDRSFYTAGDVQALLDVSESKAYKMIRAMRNECVAAKLISPAYPAGKIPKKYFNEHCML